MSVPTLTRDGTPWSPRYVDRIDGKRCLGCGRCFKVCGQGVLEMKWMALFARRMHQPPIAAQRHARGLGRRGRTARWNQWR